ncbi:hypothetical protein ACLOJK_041490 [Asimina triloba]
MNSSRQQTITTVQSHNAKILSYHHTFIQRHFSESVAQISTQPPSPQLPFQHLVPPFNPRTLTSSIVKELKGHLAALPISSFVAPSSVTYDECQLATHLLDALKEHFESILLSMSSNLEAIRHYLQTTSNELKGNLEETLTFLKNTPTNLELLPLFVNPYILTPSNYSRSRASTDFERDFEYLKRRRRILEDVSGRTQDTTVQDFMEQSENTARSVGKLQLQKIYKCIHGTLDQLASFMKGQIQEPQIKQLLFGSDALLAPGLPFIYNANLKRIQKSGDSNQKKKAKKARDTKSARSNEFSDSSKFILKGVDGINSVASMPNNGLGHKGDNHCLGERGQFPQTGSSHPQIEFVGTTAQTSTVSVSQQLQTGSQHSSMGLERQHILNAVDKKSDTGQRHIPTAQTGSQHPQIGYIGSAAQNSTVSNPSVSQQPQTGSQHPSVGPNSQQLPNPVVQKTGNGERCISTAHTRSQHPQIGLVGSAAQDSTASSPSVSQLPQTGPQHPSMGLNKQHIPNPMVQKTYTGQTCIPIAQTGSQHPQMGFVGSAAQNSTVSNPGVSQWPPWPQTGSQHPSMRLSGQHIPNPKFQKTDTGQRCIPTAQKGSQHLQI